MWAILGNICERAQGNLWACAWNICEPNTMENIWVIYMGNIYVGFKKFMGLCGYFCEWTSKIKARKFVTQHSSQRNNILGNSGTLFIYKTKMCSIFVVRIINYSL